MKIPTKQLKRLGKTTDDIGLIQHSQLDDPDLKHGYSIDDIARGLIVLSRFYPKFKDRGLHNTYLEFIYDAKRTDGFFHNFRDKNGNWRVEEPDVLQDCFGRTLWGLAEFIKSSYPRDERAKAEKVFKDSLETSHEIKFPHSLAFTLLGVSKYCNKRKSKNKKDIARKLSDQLLYLFREFESRNWIWPSNSLTYCNARIPQSLLLGSRILDDERTLKIGLDSLDFLIKMSFDEDVFLGIGNNGWFKKGGRNPLYDQQTIEAGAMAEACFDGSRVTGEKKYNEHGRNAFSWFAGKNIAKKTMLDNNGGVYDAITSDGINRNQGAESLLSYLLAASSV